jgi:hypothetical protein
MTPLPLPGPGARRVESSRAGSGGAKMAILPFWIGEGTRELDERGLARAGRADQGYVLRSGRDGREGSGGIRPTELGQDTGS